MVQVHTLLALAALSFAPVHSIELDSSNFDSIRSAASGIAHGLVSLYNGNETGEIPGILGMPYYFWEAGAMFDVLIQYYTLSGDNQYNGIVSQGLLFQQGENGNFMPTNQSASLGNDDQSTWALAALSAAEGRFPGASDTTWAALADTVFNNQVLRWDEDTCDGGLRWQIYAFNTGYNYKNSISNGQFFQLASRLAHRTGNITYSEWASKVFDWTKESGFIDEGWNVYDGAHAANDCDDLNKLQFSNSAGTYITGAANLYNITTGESQKKWKDVLDGLLDRNLETFFPDGIAFEVACEPKMTCTVDMKAFKGLLAHQLVDAVRVAPYISDKIRPLLTSSAEAAANACNDSGDNCRLDWLHKDASTKSSGVGEQLSALSYVQALLFWDESAPTSSGNTSTEGSDSGSPTTSGSPSSTESGSPTITSNSAAVLGSGNAIMIMSSSVWALMSWFAL